jgi:hypothetical protein
MFRPVVMDTLGADWQQDAEGEAAMEASVAVQGAVVSAVAHSMEWECLAAWKDRLQFFEW